MPLSALLLVLAAAGIHAAWNVVLSGSEDTHAASAVAVSVGVVLFAPVAALTWRLHAGAWPYLVVSSALETLYLALLASGYARADMSFVYPIARGSAPVIVLVVGAVALGTSVSAAAAVGVVLVALGIVLVRGLQARGGMADIALALAVGSCIAAYTLVDKHGIEHANPFSYLELDFALMAAFYVAGVARLRGSAALQRTVRAPTLLAGVGFFGSYLLVLAALRLAPAAAVAAVRESSVVIAAAALALGGRERVTRERFLGSAVVLGGLLLVALS